MAARLSELELLHIAALLVQLSCNAAAATAEELEGLHCRADGSTKLQGFSVEDNGFPERETEYGTDHPDESTIYSSVHHLHAHRASSLLHLSVAIVMK